MFKTFIHTGAAWYAKSALDPAPYFDQIHISVYEDESCEKLIGEFSLNFHELNSGVGTRLCCFDDGAAALKECLDIIDLMDRMSKHPQSPEAYVSFFDRSGYADKTPLTAS